MKDLKEFVTKGLTSCDPGAEVNKWIDVHVHVISTYSLPPPSLSPSFSPLHLSPSLSPFLPPSLSLSPLRVAVSYIAVPERVVKS